MRIAIFSDTFLPQVNGVVSHLLLTAQKLTERGNQVLVFAPKPKKNISSFIHQYSFKTLLVPSIPLPLYPDFRISVPYIPKILYELKKFSAEVIQVMDPLNLGTEGLVAGKFLKIPTAITFHTFYMDEDILKYFKIHHHINLVQPGIWKLTTIYHDLANVVICPSKISQRELLKHGLKRPTEIISNGVDLATVNKISHSDKEKLRKKHLLKKNDLCALYVGRMAVDKSIPVLFGGFKRVVKQFPRAKLLMIGGGPETGKLKKLAKNLFLERNIYWLGEFDHKSLIKSGLLGIADISVTASKIENQSMAIIEAIAYGLPIVCVNARGMGELVDNTNGIMVEPDNEEELGKAIVKLFHDHKLRARLAYGSSQKAKNFDLEKAIDKLEAVYRVLINYKEI